MRTPFDWLGDVLERIHARSPLAAYFVALAIAFVCVLAIAYINQDGSSVAHWSNT